MKLLTFDVCDLHMLRKSDGKKVLSTTAQMTSVEQTVNETRIKGGIGNKDVAIVRTDKEYNLSVSDALFDTDYFEISTGVAYSSKTREIYKMVKGLVLASGAVVLPETPKDQNDVVLVNANNEQFAAVYEDTGKTATITGGVDGELYMAVYPIDVTGETLEIDATKFAQNYELQLNTIAYDPETNEVTQDIYWKFPKVLPESAFSISYEAGQNNTVDLNFKVLITPNTDIAGEVIHVDRS